MAPVPDGRRPASAKLADVGQRLEAAFDGIRDDWWRLGRELGGTDDGKLAHAPTAASYNSDLGLTMAWVRLAGALAAAAETTLMLCDDPWLFRALAGVQGVSAMPAPGLAWPAFRLAARGWLARGRLVARLAAACLAQQKTKANIKRGDNILLVYGHPASRADGYDDYFGGLLNQITGLKRLMHTDGSPARALELAAGGVTAGLHAWGRLRWLPGLLSTRWRARPADWLVRRAVARENATAVHAGNAWQMRCQDRFLAEIKPGAVAWPWENHPWERALCRTARRLGVRSIGYQHTVIGRHQTNFAPATNPDGLASFPDLVLCNGPGYRSQLLKWDVPQERLAVGGAFRIRRFKSGHFDPEGPVFVALSAVDAIAEQMLVAIARVGGKKFLVKQHPLYPHAVPKAANIAETANTIPDEPGISAVFYGTGTSGLEGLLAGVPTYRLLPDDRIAVDIMPEGVEPQPVTVDGLGAALAAHGAPPGIAWDDIFAPVDMDVWQQALAQETPQRRTPA